VNKRAWVVACTFCAIVASLATWRASTASADDWQPISPEELKMTSLPEAPGAPAVILYRQVDRDDGRSAHEFNYVRIKILTEEGRKYANVEIPFFKETGTVLGIKARSIRADGSIAQFDGKVYEQTIVKAKGFKYLAKTFTLPDVQIGSIIEYHYMTDYNEAYVYDSNWVLSNELFTRHAKFSLKPNPDFALRWNWPEGLPAGTQPPKEDHGTIRMEAQNIPAFLVEDFMPPENEMKFRVDFIYSEETSLEKDPAKFWKAESKKQNDKVENFVNKKKAMEQTVAQIVAGGDSQDAKLRKIYAKVQQLRNLNYENEKSQQEQKREKQKEVTNVEDLLKRGYGNGTQITWLFMALARAAGFDASPVLVARRSDHFFKAIVMNARQLNDNVVLVKLDGKDLYFDPGTAFTPYGMLPWWETSVSGLRLGKDGGGWVETPLNDETQSKIERNTELKLDSEGTLTGKLTVTYWGSDAQSLRIEERIEDETSRKKLLEDMVRETIPAAIEVELVNKPDWSSSSPSLQTEYSLKVPGWVAGAGKRALLPVGLFSSPEKSIFEHSGRVHPVYFHYPYRKIDDITIELPLGWKVASLAKSVDRDVKAAAYTMKSEDNSGSLHLTRLLRSDLVMVPPNSYGALRAFFQVVRTGDEEQVVLQPGSSSAGN
jgi:Domain of Unknown Function with PDB structure (DUF3857)/Transglutaminase-like superfamily